MLRGHCLKYPEVFTFLPLSISLENFQGNEQCELSNFRIIKRLLELPAISILLLQLNKNINFYIYINIFIIVNNCSDMFKSHPNAINCQIQKYRDWRLGFF